MAALHVAREAISDSGWTADDPRDAALVVGTSRAYVRIHHPSDVVAGAAVGLALGGLARALLAVAG